eukprot:UN02483
MLNAKVKNSSAANLLHRISPQCLTTTKIRTICGVLVPAKKKSNSNTAFLDSDDDEDDSSVWRISKKPSKAASEEPKKGGIDPRKLLPGERAPEFGEGVNRRERANFDGNRDDHARGLLVLARRSLCLAMTTPTTSGAHRKRRKRRWTPTPYFGDSDDDDDDLFGAKSKPKKPVKKERRESKTRASR